MACLIHAVKPRLGTTDCGSPMGLHHKMLVQGGRLWLGWPWLASETPLGKATAWHTSRNSADRAAHIAIRNNRGRPARGIRATRSGSMGGWSGGHCEERTQTTYSPELTAVDRSDEAETGRTKTVQAYRDPAARAHHTPRSAHPQMVVVVVGSWAGSQGTDNRPRHASGEGHGTHAIGEVGMLVDHAVRLCGRVTKYSRPCAFSSEDLLFCSSVFLRFCVCVLACFVGDHVCGSVSLA